MLYICACNRVIIKNTMLIFLKTYWVYLLMLSNQVSVDPGRKGRYAQICFKEKVKTGGLCYIDAKHKHNNMTVVIISLFGFIPQE